MKKSSLPVFGVGPIYVITCSLITVLAFHLKRQGFFQTGEITSFDLVFQIFGIILIFTGVFFLDLCRINSKYCSRNSIR